MLLPEFFNPVNYTHFTVAPANSQYLIMHFYIHSTFFSHSTTFYSHSSNPLVHKSTISIKKNIKQTNYERKQDI